MKKKILILLETLNEGGAQHMIYELCRFVNRDHFDVEILCYGRPSGSALEKQALQECKVHFLNLTGRITPKYVHIVIKAIRESKPDIVHAHLGGIVFSTVWSLFYRGKLMITAHTRPDKAFNKKVEPILRFMVKHRTNDLRIVAVSSENRRMLAEYFGVDVSSICCVNNGIDIEKFYRMPHENFTFINVARQDKNKNQIAILEAFYKLYQQNPHIRLILAGDGPCHQLLADRIQELEIGDAVSLPGMVGNVEDYYAVSDAYVQSSYREAMPLSALEAMAAKLPIISTNVGGMSDIVQNNGSLIDDSNNLECAMSTILNIPKQDYQVMQEESWKIVQSYSSQNMAEEYEQLYYAMVQ